MRNMTFGRLMACVALAAAPLLAASLSLAQAPPPAPAPIMPPSLAVAHSVDLMTTAGAMALGAKWKISEVKIVEAPAVQGLVTESKSTYGIEPQAGGADFDDSKWAAIEPKDLTARRSGGRLAFMWYRTPLIIPAKLGDFDPTGAVAVLTILVDDYAEIWLNGQIPRRLGRPSPATIQGFNMPNRVVLTEQVKAGDKFQIAVFGINGPISIAPANGIFFRQATMEFYK
jgi:gluconolactonase